MLICSNCWRKNCICDVSKYVKIDDGMLEIICDLNAKGYMTRNCCEGHLDKHGMCTYIQFKSVYKFTSIPKDFEYSTQKVDENLLCGITRFISVNYDKSNGFSAEVNGEILNASQLESNKNTYLTTLKDWVNHLPNLKEYE